MVAVDGDGSEPIEIELTAHEPRPGGRGRRRRDRDAAEPIVAPVAPVDSQVEGERLPPDRTRLVVVAAVTAVVALALGWMLGRTTAPDIAADDAAVTTRAGTVTTIPESLATLPIVGDEIDGAEFGEPEREEPPGPLAPRADPPTIEPTIEPAGPTSEPIAVDERLAGVPVRLVGVELGGVLVEVDLATATLTDFHADRIVSDGSALVIGTDWVATARNGRAAVIRSDGTESPIDDAGDFWGLLHVPGTDLFWKTAHGGAPGDVGEVELIDLAGEPVGPKIELPVNGWPYLVDPATGGVVIGAAGRQYVVTPDSVEPLATGEVVGITPDIVVTYECGDALECSLFRVDRGTGVRTAVRADPDLDEPYQWGTMAGWGGSRSDAVSPDGRWIGVVGMSWRSSVAGIVELDTGRFVELTQLRSPPTVAWSPDSRFAFHLDDQVVTAYDTVTGDRFPVFTDAVRWMQLGARPLTTPEPGSEGGTLLSAAPEQPVEG